MKRQNRSHESRAFSRREFLKKGGAVAAGMMIAPRVTMAAGPVAENSPKKIRIGVVGGGFGAAFFWHLHPNCKVEAVSDLIPERRNRLMEVYKCSKSYESLEKLILDRNVDAVAIFTGAPDHARHAVMTLKAGKHVVSAVPAVTSQEDAELLLATVKETGLTYMMAETSWYHQEAIAVREMYRRGDFGEIFYTEAEYHHPGLEALWFTKDGKPTWRHGMPPMHYPTHMTAFVVGITGERLVSVSCLGWTDNSKLFEGNPYGNKFWNETALFKTSRGNALRAQYIKRGACRGAERAEWYGEKMSFISASPNGYGPLLIKGEAGRDKDDAGYEHKAATVEPFTVPEYWKTEMLPKELQISSGHGQSHTFLTHEFIDALVKGRRPAIDIYEALAMTVPGIIAHRSAMRDGECLKIPSYDPA